MELQYKSNYYAVAQTLSSVAPTVVYMPAIDKGLMGYLKKINFCNTGTDTTINVGVAKMGDVINQDKQYLEYGLAIKANESYALALDIGLRAWDKLFVWAGNNKVAINVFGIEEANMK